MNSVVALYGREVLPRVGSTIADAESRGDALSAGRLRGLEKRLTEAKRP